MSTGIAKSNNIRRIVSIRQMLQRWRKKARVTASSRRSGTGDAPSDVPAGHVAICVGSSCRRFVVRATYLNHPIFQKLLLQAEEEYGFTNQGPLAIPCDESVFEEVLRTVSRSDSGRFLNFQDFRRRCHVDSPSSLLRESRPLLFDFADKSVC
ncbi:indole-3-acetic acid-induced protein ARG7-like [Benincasa hispida]|uniref:indole-3-acetic acid-induced protein ARG7-like n=1 Tax=Benincasa hispida TaxID=102211 RepID=UPI001901072D|nr:indole-3-acetic acid-induced protein ARG7-like [Benincasa hispida]